MVNVRGFFGELGWGWRLLFGLGVTIVVAKLSCAGVKSVTTDFAQYTNTDAPHNAVRNARRLAREATGDSDSTTRLNAEVEELRGRLAQLYGTLTREREQHATELRRAEERAETYGSRASTCEQARDSIIRNERTCNMRIVDYYNSFCTCTTRRAMLTDMP